MRGSVPLSGGAITWQGLALRGGFALRSNSWILGIFGPDIFGTPNLMRAGYPWSLVGVGSDFPKSRSARTNKKPATRDVS
jgi:hypothetical protein